MMHLPYFSLLDWLVIGFFLILFIALSLLSAQAKKTSIVLGGVFASFLVSTFGGLLGIIIIEKYTKSAVLIKVKERRVLFNESLFIDGFIKNNGRVPLNYCELNIRLVNGDRNKYSKGTFFSAGGINIFGKKEKENAKPQVIEKKKYIPFNPPLKPAHLQPFSVSIEYPGYFRNAMIIKKLNCH